MVNFIQIPKFVSSDDVSKANSITILNPTGTLTMEQTFEMNGSNDKIQQTDKIAADNLKKSNENQFNCNIENFNSSNNYKKLLKNKRILYLLVLLIIILIIILLIELFKK